MVSAAVNAFEKPLVIIESPYAGEVQRNLIYARKALKHSILRGEAPIASHLLLPQILDDLDPEQRALGIAAGIAWYRVCELVVFYVDYGYSAGMKDALAFCEALKVPMEERRLEVL